MYNRYIPQPDGSFARRQIAEKRPTPPPPPPPPKSEESCPPPPPPQIPPCPPPPPAEPPCPPKPPQKHESVPGFLQSLLPRDFDTGDLIVVLLLLLLAGDCEEDRSTALLTLALYLFL